MKNWISPAIVLGIVLLLLGSAYLPTVNKDRR